jgi:hypothetical protein
MNHRMQTSKQGKIEELPGTLHKVPGLTGSNLTYQICKNVLNNKRTFDSLDEHGRFRVLDHLGLTLLHGLARPARLRGLIY